MSALPKLRPSASRYFTCTPYTATVRNMSGQSTRRRFAPLSKNSTSKDTTLKGIVFDMDGTLCEPQNYMFKEMRSACSIPPGNDILDHINALPDKEREEAFEKIRAIERAAMSKQVPQPGLTQLMEYLDERGIRKAICTRNFDAPVKHLLEKHIQSHIAPFSPIITREFRPAKPSPAGILHIAHHWGVISTAEVPATPAKSRPIPLIMVGDSIDDMVAGYEAGAITVLLKSEGKEELEEDERTDVVISRLDDLIGLLDEGLVSLRD